MNRGISPARKLVYSIALIPIVPAISIVIVILSVQWFAPTPPLAFDEVRPFQAAFSVCCVLCAILIWRRFVLWTLGRVWLTALIGMIPFVQVAVNAPLFRIAPKSCDLDLSEYFLRIGQHQTGVGLWIWLTVWCWWGWERRSAAATRGLQFVERIRMSTVAKRILLSLGSIPIVFGVFLISAVLLDRFIGLSKPVWPALSVAALAHTVIWIGIWKSCVEWDARTVWITFSLIFGCFVLPIGLLAFVESFISKPQLGLYQIFGALPLLGWGFWMALSFWMWPGSAFGSRNTSDSLKCLKCGYLLTGLRATRCPECGNEPTLDELWEGHRSDV